MPDEELKIRISVTLDEVNRALKLLEKQVATTSSILSKGLTFGKGLAEGALEYSDALREIGKQGEVTANIISGIDKKISESNKKATQSQRELNQERAKAPKAGDAIAIENKNLEKNLELKKKTIAEEKKLEQAQQSRSQKQPKQVPAPKGRAPKVSSGDVLSKVQADMAKLGGGIQDAIDATFIQTDKNITASADKQFEEKKKQYKRAGDTLKKPKASKSMASISQKHPAIVQKEKGIAFEQAIFDLPFLREKFPEIEKAFSAVQKQYGEKFKVSGKPLTTKLVHDVIGMTKAQSVPKQKKMLATMSPEFGKLYGLLQNVAPLWSSMTMEEKYTGAEYGPATLKTGEAKIALAKAKEEFKKLAALRPRRMGKARVGVKDLNVEQLARYQELTGMISDLEQIASTQEESVAQREMEEATAKRNEPKGRYKFKRGKKAPGKATGQLGISPEPIPEPISITEFRKYLKASGGTIPGAAAGLSLSKGMREVSMVGAKGSALSQGLMMGKAGAEVSGVLFGEERKAEVPISAITDLRKIFHTHVSKKAKNFNDLIQKSFPSSTDLIALVMQATEALKTITEGTLETDILALSKTSGTGALRTVKLNLKNLTNDKIKKIKEFLLNNKQITDEQILSLGFEYTKARELASEEISKAAIEAEKTGIVSFEKRRKAPKRPATLVVGGKIKTIPLASSENKNIEKESYLAWQEKELVVLSKANPQEKISAMHKFLGTLNYDVSNILSHWAEKGEGATMGYTGPQAEGAVGTVLTNLRQKSGKSKEKLATLFALYENNKGSVAETIKVLIQELVSTTKKYLKEEVVPEKGMSLDIPIAERGRKSKELITKKTGAVESDPELRRVLAQVAFPTKGQQPFKGRYAEIYKMVKEAMAQKTVPEIEALVPDFMALLEEGPKKGFAKKLRNVLQLPAGKKDTGLQKTKEVLKQKNQARTSVIKNIVETEEEKDKAVDEIFNGAVTQVRVTENLTKNLKKPSKRKAGPMANIPYPMVSKLMKAFWSEQWDVVGGLTQQLSPERGEITVGEVTKWAANKQTWFLQSLKKNKGFRERVASKIGMVGKEGEVGVQELLALGEKPYVSDFPSGGRGGQRHAALESALSAAHIAKSIAGNIPQPEVPMPTAAPVTEKTAQATVQVTRNIAEEQTILQNIVNLTREAGLYEGLHFQNIEASIQALALMLRVKADIADLEKSITTAEIQHGQAAQESTGALQQQANVEQSTETIVKKKRGRPKKVKGMYRVGQTPVAEEYVSELEREAETGIGKKAGKTVTKIEKRMAQFGIKVPFQFDEATLSQAPKDFIKKVIVPLSKIKIPVGEKQVNLVTKEGLTNLIGLNKVLDSTGKTVTDAGVGFRQLGDHVKGSLQRVIGYGSAGWVIYSVTRTFVDLFKVIIDTDQQLAKLGRTLIGTKGDFAGLRQIASSFATTFGKSIPEIVQVMGKFSEQWKNAEDIISLTQSALVLSNISGQELGASVENLTASMLQFGVQAKDSMKIADSWANVSAHAAVTVDTLGDAASVAGEVAKNAGINFDLFNGIVAATAAATSSSGREIGNALARLVERGAAPESVKKLEELGIAMHDATDPSELRGMDSVLKEVARGWEGYTETQKRSVSSAIIGAKQAKLFQGLMKNWSVVISSTKDSINSQGAAWLQNQKVMDSTIKTYAQFQARMQNLAVVAGSSLLPVINILIDSLNGLGKTFEMLPPAMQTVAVGIGVLVGAISTLSFSLSMMGVSMGGLFALLGSTKLFSTAIVGFKILKESITAVGAASTWSQVSSLGFVTSLIGFGKVILIVGALIALFYGLNWAIKKSKETAEDKFKASIQGHLKTIEQTRDDIAQNTRLTASYNEINDQLVKLNETRGEGRKTTTQVNLEQKRSDIISELISKNQKFSTTILEQIRAGKDLNDIMIKVNAEREAANRRIEIQIATGAIEIATAKMRELNAETEKYSVPKAGRFAGKTPWQAESIKIEKGEEISKTLADQKKRVNLLMTGAPGTIFRGFAERTSKQYEGLSDTEGFKKFKEGVFKDKELSFYIKDIIETNGSTIAEAFLKQAFALQQSAAETKGTFANVGEKYGNAYKVILNFVEEALAHNERLIQGINLERERLDLQLASGGLSPEEFGAKVQEIEGKKLSALKTQTSSNVAAVYIGLTQVFKKYQAEAKGSSSLQLIQGILQNIGNIEPGKIMPLTTLKNVTDLLTDTLQRELGTKGIELKGNVPLGITAALEEVKLDETSTDEQFRKVGEELGAVLGKGKLLPKGKKEILEIIANIKNYKDLISLKERLGNIESETVNNIEKQKMVGKEYLSIMYTGNAELEAQTKIYGDLIDQNEERLKTVKAALDDMAKTGKIANDELAKQLRDELRQRELSQRLLEVTKSTLEGLPSYIENNIKAQSDLDFEVTKTNMEYNAQIITYDELLVRQQEQVQKQKELNKEANIFQKILLDIGESSYKKMIEQFTTGISGKGILSVFETPTTKLAGGGKITKPTYALIGEAGPEYVIPEKDLKKLNGGAGGYGFLDFWSRQIKGAYGATKQGLTNVSNIISPKPVSAMEHLTTQQKIAPAIIQYKNALSESTQAQESANKALQAATESIDYFGTGIGVSSDKVDTSFNLLPRQFDKIGNMLISGATDTQKTFKSIQLAQQGQVPGIKPEEKPIENAIGEGIQTAIQGMGIGTFASKMVGGGGGVGSAIGGGLGSVILGPLGGVLGGMLGGLFDATEKQTPVLEKQEKHLENIDIKISTLNDLMDKLINAPSNFTMPFGKGILEGKALSAGIIGAATGGYVTKPGLAFIHAGETITPSNTINGGISISVNGSGDPATVADVVMSKLQTVYSGQGSRTGFKSRRF